MAEREAGDAVRLLTPERGTKHQLVLLAEENAAAAIADHLRNEALDRQATAELRRLLRLDVAPRRIEGFDISNIMGTSPSRPSWCGKTDRPRRPTRKFRIQTVEGANDFASMQEAVMRRYGATEDLATAGSHPD